MTELSSLDGDTIAAIATAPGRGGIGIIRLSGPQALPIAQQITGVDFRPRFAHFCEFRSHQDQRLLDSGVALAFPGPHSFTGEDVVELQGHGGPVILDILLRECCQLGARLALPGEFSQRAYLNDKIDLTQAEAIADLIDSTTEAAALNATQSLQGAFSREIEALVSAVTALRVYVEAAIDFPEEEIDFIAEGQVKEQLLAIKSQMERVHSQAQQGSLLRDGMKLVIAGRPNAGKSSLLNALSGQDRAIVTPIEGTTRDVLREHIQIDGIPLHVVDTAGLRDSDDAVEQEGIRRAWQEMESADHIILVVDATQATQRDENSHSIWPEKDQHRTRNIPVTVVHNKIDSLQRSPSIEVRDDATVIGLSALTGEGLDLLRQHLKESVGYASSEAGLFSARRRHLDALDRAEHFLTEGLLQLEGSGAGELLAEDLRQCQHALGEITGTVSSDELLGHIFSSFCIGK